MDRMDNDHVPKDVYGIEDPDAGYLAMDTDFPLDIGWNNLFPIRMPDYSGTKYLHEKDELIAFKDTKPMYYQTQMVDSKYLAPNVPTTNAKTIPVLYMGSDADGVKECLSYDDADDIQPRGSRKTHWAECLKISVEANPAWDQNAVNYCYHDRSSEVMKLQYLNVAGWMIIEWGVTAGVTVIGTPAAGAATKPVMGLVAGAGCEYVDQYLLGSYNQVWPGHPP